MPRNEAKANETNPSTRSKSLNRILVSGYLPSKSNVQYPDESAAAVGKAKHNPRTCESESSEGRKQQYVVEEWTYLLTAGSIYSLKARSIRLDVIYKNEGTYSYLSNQSTLRWPDSILSIATVSGFGPLSCTRAKILSASVPNLTAAFARMKEVTATVTLSYETTLRVAPMAVVS